MELTLRFAQMECERCGTPRIVCTACPSCGSPADEREADVRRQRRQRIVKRAQDALLDPTSFEKPSTPTPVLEDLGRLISQLDESAADFENKPEAVATQQLSAAAQTLRRITDQAEAGDKRRPWVASWRALDPVIRATKSAFDTYMAVLVADNPLTAQRKQPELQQSLDRAAAALGDLNGKFDRFHSVSEPSAAGDDLISLAAAAFNSTGASDLLDFDRKGSEFASRITGCTTFPQGIGLVVAMRAMAVELVLDEDRFFKVARDTYDVLAARPEALRCVCDNADWLADNVAASIEARDAATAAQSIAHSAWNARLGVRALLTLGHAIVEGPGKFVLASLIAAKTGRAYDRLRDEDAGSLITKTESAGFGPSIQGLDRAVRNAQAHSDWLLTADGVVLRPGKPGSQTLSIDDLLDLVLCGVESLLALDTALLLAAASTGTDYSEVDWREALSLNDANAARLMLAAAGWEDVSADVNDSILSISGRAPERAFSVAVLGALSPCLSPGLSRIRLEVTHSDGRLRVLEGPAELIRPSSASRSDMDKGVAFIELLRHFQLDGKPIASVDHVRRWSTSIMMPALQAPLAEAVLCLRTIRALGERVGDDEIVEVANESMRLSRRIAMGDVADLADSPTLRTVYRWANLPVKPLEIGLTRQGLGCQAVSACVPVFRLAKLTTPDQRGALR